ncbi:hypothetical protein [Marinagarivorans algicola]|uniref:hypothetical protein n=1 Tax=Marinagarivorans algicola TaxID=1513270 RepID=UPI003736FC5D
MKNNSFIVGGIFSLLCFCLSTFYLYALVEQYTEWFIWYSKGAEEQVVVGAVAKVYELKLKESGKQFIYINAHADSLIRLDSVFSKKTVSVLKNKKAQMAFKYYLTPTGNKYIYSVSELSSKVNIYNKSPVKTGWAGILMLFVFLLLLMPISLSAYAIRHFYKRGEKAFCWDRHSF